jgi:hypothetical protein
MGISRVVTRKGKGMTQSRADKLLEGFKLGSLGVSRKPKVTPQSDASEKSTLTVVKEGANKHPTDGVLYPYFFWKEADGWSYCLCVEVDMDKYYVRVFGGTAEFELKTIDDEWNKFRGWIVPNGGFSWIIHSNLDLASSSSTIFRLYNHILSFVKKIGSKFLTSDQGCRLLPNRKAQTFKLWLETHEA